MPDGERYPKHALTNIPGISIKGSIRNFLFLVMFYHPGDKFNRGNKREDQ